jgi:small subunit ribosomal protein S1
MSDISAAEGGHDTGESFEALFQESIDKADKNEGSVVEGLVIAIDNDMAVIDVGLKSEGRVPLKEFASPGDEGALSVGDKVEVFLDRIENRRGEAVLSRERARREEAWVVLEKGFENGERVEGVIFGRVKGGFTVDLDGAVAFLPGSQVDVRPVRDITPLLNTKQPFQILKMDRRRGNIVVSRRAVMEETRAEARAELVASLKEGQVLDGVVKNITDYGAFVDLGEVDGLLHVTDIAWRRVGHPTEVLSIGQTVKVQVIRFNVETQRISLGMKQLEADPWDGVELKYPVKTKYKGRVTNITDYGAFVELEPGVEGLVHVSEMSWTKKNVHPGKIVSTSQEVEVMVLDVDPQKRRISLGLKQCVGNPWDTFAEGNAVGTEIEGEIKNITEFGVFVGLTGDIDGLVHLSDLDWERTGEEAIKDFRKGEMVKAKVLDIDISKERISLGIKQLSGDPFASAMEGIARGTVVTGVVSAITDGGIELTVNDGALGFVRKAELARDRRDQRPDRFAVGDKVDAKVTQLDSGTRRLTLSIKALEIADEKQAMAEYGSSDSGASLGDILGAAMKAKAEDSPDEDPAAEDEADAAPEPEAESEPEAETAPQAEAKPEAEAKAESETAAEPEAEAAAEPEAEAAPEADDAAASDDEDKKDYAS